MIEEISCSYFNSIKVRLNLALLSVEVLEIFHFNSIKVRLNRGSCRGRQNLSRFQFHKGTIKPLLQIVDS